MSTRRIKTLMPRNGRVFVIGIVARISGGPNQKELSLEDQVDHGKEEISNYCDGPCEYRVVATIGKGEDLDRPELGNIEAMLRTKELDYLVCEDIGRIVRGAEAARICGIAVDCGTRVIAPNDGIDTAEDNWEEDVLAACKEHVGHNRHTSRRIKHKLMNRFKKFGGATARETYGYFKPYAGAPYGDWTKVDEATPIIKECFRLARETLNYTVVADWLNSRGIPTGKYTRNKKWTGKLVKEMLSNSILKGMPSRGHTLTVKNNEEGQWKKRPNPDGPVFYPCPHLAHVDAAEFDEVNAMLRAEKQGCGRKPVNGLDPRKGVLKKHTVYPGQQIDCGVCGRLFVWGGHGVKEHMMCNGVRESLCWCTVSFDGNEAAIQLCNAALAAIEKLPGFDQEFLNQLNLNADAAHREKRQAEVRLEREAMENEKGMNNVLDSIQKYGHSDALAGRLREIETQKLRIAAQRTSLRLRSNVQPQLPPMNELKEIARQRIGALAVNDAEFGRLMRQLMPQILVFPFKAIDSDHVVARALVTLDLVNLIPEPLGDMIGGLLRQEYWVDLFHPPKRVLYREKVATLRSQGLKQRDIAKGLGLTQPIVQQALALDEMMQVRGLTDPYEILTAPPTGPKYKMHLHPRFRFEPLEGFPAFPQLI